MGRMGRKQREERRDLKFYRAALGRPISWATICRDVGGGNLTYPSNAGYPRARAREQRRVRIRRARVCATNTRERTDDDVAYSPICLAWHRGRKRSGCLALAFRHTPTPPLPPPPPPPPPSRCRRPNMSRERRTTSPH